MFLATRLIQEVQAAFAHEDYPLLKAVTRIYLDHADTVMKTPVSVSNGYGCALGQQGTFRERTERFAKLLARSKDSLKQLYSCNVDEVAALMFLYDIGVVTLSDEVRATAEQEVASQTLCGASFVLLQQAAMQEQLGDKANGLSAKLVMLYSRLRGSEEGDPEVVIAANMIRLDREAIESIERLIRKPDGPVRQAE